MINKGYTITHHKGGSLTGNNSSISRKGPVVIILLLLGIANYPLILGEIHTAGIFFPDAVLGGQWWLIVTHPLVHLSWYHLLLDGASFVMLFLLIEEQRRTVQLLYIIGSAAGSLLFAVVLESAIFNQGLCGLSGIAHGLMTITSLEMIRHKELRKLGCASLAIVLLKCGYEIATGAPFLEWLHMGLMGNPVEASHAGGVIGGMIIFVIVKLHGALRLKFSTADRMVNRVKKPLDHLSLQC